ncbi:MAG: pilus assembly PilX family protein [Sulfuricaulis sp.]
MTTIIHLARRNTDDYSYRQQLPAVARYGHAQQRGATLITSLVFLIILTILGLAAVGTNTLDQRMAANLQDQHSAFQAAEASLRVGEESLNNYSPYPPAPVGCSSTSSAVPICVFGTSPVTTLANWTSTFANSSSNSALPGYYVVELRSIVPDTSMLGSAAPTGRWYYRVTGYGTGANTTSTSQELLQSEYVIRFGN